MVTVNLESNRWGRQHLLFTVPLPARDPVFMSMSIDECTNDTFGIIVVDAGEFLNFWRANPGDIHREEAHGSPETWPDDYKFDKAVAGFSRGRIDPVPLADISYYVPGGPTPQKIEALQINDGVTRTIWLLTQGCQAFPVKCGLSCMEPLTRAAVPGSLPYTVRELASIGAVQY